MTNTLETTMKITTSPASFSKKVSAVRTKIQKMTQQKYQEVNGIRKYNPAYVVPPSAPAAVPFINQSTALPVIAVPVSAVVAE